MKRLLIILSAAVLCCMVGCKKDDDNGNDNVNRPDYLYIEAIEPGTVVRLNKMDRNAHELTAEVEYSLDLEHWTAYTWGVDSTLDYLGVEIRCIYGAPITLTKAGERVYFRAGGAEGKNATFSGAEGGKTYTFQCDKKYKAGGNVMSLLDRTCQQVRVPNNAFCALFWASPIVKAPKLPGTVLGKLCYYMMFQGCTELTEAPELPAMQLRERCYQVMFGGCTSLEVAPKLPATMLAEGCYFNMFYECTALKVAPGLPATTLVEGCYRSMFYGCTSLEHAPALPATTMAEGCYFNMFNACESLKEAPELPATTLAKNCYRSMFRNCTALEHGPVLPAATLAEGCYCYMFNYCDHLTTVTCLATDVSAEECLKEWLYTAGESAPSRTLTVARGMKSTMEQYVPTSPVWNVVEQ